LVFLVWRARLGRLCFQRILLGETVREKISTTVHKISIHG